jgi:lysozyme family protein
MMTFDIAVEKVLKHEGGYTFNPLDTGGATNYGITLAVARENGFDGDMRDLTKDQAKQIYRVKYWDAIKAESLPSDVRFHVFDAAVNSGVTQAIRWLQRVVGTDADGVIGPITIAAANNIPGTVLAARYSGQRLMFMTGLKNWNAFGAGWARRIASNMMEA